MSSSEFFSYASGVVFFAAYVPYFLDIFIGEKTKPTPTTWFIWTIVDGILLWTLYDNGLNYYQVAGATAAAFAMFLISLFMGTRGFSPADGFAVACATCGFGVLFLSTDKTVDVLAMSIVIFVAGLPMYVKVAENPRLENKWAWLIMFISCLLALAAIPQWTVIDAAQPISFTLVETIMVILTFMPCRH